MTPPKPRPELAALESALRPLTEGALAACEGVLARVWLEGPGDSCERCVMRSECPDQRRCLHLVASAGLTTRIDGPFRRIPIGARLVGRVPQTRKAVIARENLPSLGVAEPAWLRLHGVQSFAALPLAAGNRSVGVLVVFSRSALEPTELQRLESLARLAALTFDHLHAFRALSADRNRVAARNARLVERARAAGVTVEGLSVPADPAPEFLVGEEPMGDEHADPAAAHAAHAAAAHAALDPFAPPGAEPGGFVRRTFAEIQRDAIQRTLEHTRWRVSGPRGAASILGLRPTTLESKMKKLGVRRPPRG